MTAQSTDSSAGAGTGMNKVNKVVLVMSKAN